MSERHPLDLFSLVAGLVFVGIGTALVVTESTVDSGADLGWIVAALLVGLGLAGALGGLVRKRPPDRDAPAVDQEATDQEVTDQEVTDQEVTDQEEVSP